MVQRQLAGSRERARALIMAGRVLVDDQPVDKAGTQVDQEASIRLKGEDIPYVSRGGLKLARALEAFQVTAAGRTALDVGASKGWFERFSIVLWFLFIGRLMPPTKSRLLPQILLK